MALTVRERGETVATLRYVHVRLMETLAAWVPTTPEMEVKLLFGTHVWDTAQHADALGKRTFELRMPLQHSLAPCEPYDQLLSALAAVEPTAERIAYFYDAMLPTLAARYRAYLERTDTLLDAPTVRILEHLAHEQARMIRESEELREQLPALALSQRAPVDGWLAREAAIVDFVVHRPERASVGAP
jgi:hypothetical protein